MTDTTNERTAVVLLNLGGPTSADACTPFLYNLFSDPDLIRLGGGGFQRWLAGVISKRRGPKVARKYAQINACAQGCQGSAFCPNHGTGKPSDACSPLNPLTEAQRRAVETRLQQRYPGRWLRAYTCMRYHVPDTDRVLAQLLEDGITQVVLLPLYPQYSFTTTGSSFKHWEHRKRQSTWQESRVKSYPTHPLLVQAISRRMDEALLRFAPTDRHRVQVVFSAHGTPLAEVRRGDPYTHEVAQTVQAVMEHRNHDLPHWLAFQSRVGPAKWTTPNTVDLVEHLVEGGQRHLLLVPVAFVTDHIETLFELKKELPEELEHLGPLHLEVTQGLNDLPEFVEALASLAAQSLGWPQPAALPHQALQHA